jgi:SH3-like domain-containing protein
MKFVPTSALIFLLLTGCVATKQVTPASITTPVISVVSSVMPTSMSQAITPTTVLALTSPFVPFYVVTNSENVMLRAGPGIKFDAKTTLKQGLQLQVLSRAPGGEWIFAQTPFESTGWVSAGLLKSDKDLQLVPLMQPPDIQVIRGRVLNEKKEPVAGISFGILEDVEGSKSFSAVTDASGMFYGFLPSTAKGAWSVTFDKALCTSNTMDKNCNCIGTCGGASPMSARVVLPQTEMLVFDWH